MPLLRDLLEALLLENTLSKGSQRVLANKNLVQELADAIGDDIRTNPTSFPPGFIKIYIKSKPEDIAKWFLENLDKIEKEGYEGTIWARDGINNEWLVRRYIAGSHNWEDLTGVMNLNLRDWHLLKNRSLLQPTHSDLWKYKSVRDVGSYINTHYEQHMKDVREAAATAALKKTAKSAKIVDNQDYKIYTVFNWNAAKVIGLGTQWCTANTKYNGNYERYSNSAMLFQLLPTIKEKDEKGRIEKYQFDAGGPYFMDVLDHPVQPEIVRDKFPFLYTDLVSGLRTNKGKLETAMKEMKEDSMLQSDDGSRTKVYNIDDEIAKLSVFLKRHYFTDLTRPSEKLEKPENEDS